MEEYGQWLKSAQEQVDGAFLATENNLIFAEYADGRTAWRVTATLTLPRGRHIATLDYISPSDTLLDDVEAAEQLVVRKVYCYAGVGPDGNPVVPRPFAPLPLLSYLPLVTKEPVPIEPIVCQYCGMVIMDYVGGQVTLPASRVAALTQEHWGEALCYGCSSKRSSQEAAKSKW